MGIRPSGRVSRRRDARLAAVVVLLASATGCATSVSGQRSTDYKPGSVLVLPPRDVVQDGKPHTKGVGSGQVLLDFLDPPFKRSAFVMVRTTNPAFTGTKIATREEALEEARRLGATYCLQLVLGEFLDAAPFTFRADSVTLDQGVMWETATGAEVWRLDKPTTFTKSNIGPYTPLLDEMAQSVVKSVAPRG
jgi:hypothetical protein